MNLLVDSAVTPSYLEIRCLSPSGVTRPALTKIFQPVRISVEYYFVVTHKFRFMEVVCLAVLVQNLPWCASVTPFVNTGTENQISKELDKFSIKCLKYSKIALAFLYVAL